MEIRLKKIKHNSLDKLNVLDLHNKLDNRAISNIKIYISFFLVDIVIVWLIHTVKNPDGLTGGKHSGQAFFLAVQSPILIFTVKFLIS